MSLTIGSLCSGYGGLDMALESFFGAETAWFSEFDAAPSKVLAAHWPNVPNLGDMTTIDWSSVPAVDIIAGGTPCQDLSAAGRRKGMTEGTRSNLWVQMREAIAVIRPSIVVWENVRGAFSAYATSEVESESGLLGVYGLDRPALRALGRVLGDLSDLGYDAEWVGVRASDAGAPHSRFRVFVLAYANGGGSGRWPAQPGATRCNNAAVRSGSGSAAQDADLTTGGERWQSAPGQTQGGRTRADIGGRDRAFDPNRGNGYVSNTTPWWAEDATAADSERGGRDGRAPIPLRGEVERVATAGGREDTATDTMRIGFGEHTGESSAEETRTHSGNELADHHGVRPATEWGPYRPAIERWERVLGRFAPAPTELSETHVKTLRRRLLGRDRRPVGMRGSLAARRSLSPRFVEWMMGLPAGWVTAPEIDLTRNQELKALGNGVVPQQAELALSILWHRMSQGVAA